MSILKATTLAALLVVGTAPSAFGAGPGSAASVTGPAGSVLLSRGSQMTPLKTGAALTEGDVVVALSKGSAVLSFGDCSINVEGSSSVHITADMCASGPNPATLAPEPGFPSGSFTTGSYAGGGSGAGGCAIFCLTSIAIPVVAIAAAIMEITDDEEPASP